MSGILSQFGYVAESTYGTAVAPAKYIEINKEGIAGDYARIESAGLRAATRTLRSDRWIVNPKGAAGTVEMEVQSKSFGFWLKHMLGTVATAGPVDTLFTHTGTVGSMTGNSVCVQVGRPDTTQTVRPFMYSGGKIMSWTLSNAVDGLLLFTPTFDFQTENITASGVNVLGTASYPSTTQLMSFLTGSFKIGGVELAVKDVTIKCDNGLDGNRYFIKTLQGQKEQIENAMRKITIDVTAEFESMTQYTQVASLTTAGATAGITVYWQSPVLGGTTTFPNLLATATAARFDTATPVVEGAKLLEQKLSFTVLYDGTNSPLQLAYTTADATPL